MMAVFSSSSSLIRLLLLLTVSLACLDSTLGLECYNCGGRSFRSGRSSSNSNATRSMIDAPNSGGGPESRQFAMTTCPEDDKDNWKKVDCAGMCTKVTIEWTEGGKTRKDKSRGCDSVKTDAKCTDSTKSGDVKDGVQESSQKTTTCYCSDDLCNVSRSLTSSSWMIQLGLLLLGAVGMVMTTGPFIL